VSTKVPVYLLLDVSYSMGGTPLVALNHALRDLVRSLQEEPETSDLIMLCIISFSDDAQVDMPLTALTDIKEVPHLAARGGTSYVPALQLLRSTIERDIPSLKAEGYQVYRPIAFFLTDGYPSDSLPSLQVAIQNLHASPRRPTLVALGIGDVDPRILRQLAGAKGQSSISNSRLSPAEAITGFKELLLATINSFTRSLASGLSAWRIPSTDAFSTAPDDWL
jgi:uncharacterized protein YegL